MATLPGPRQCHATTKQELNAAAASLSKVLAGPIADGLLKVLMVGAGKGTGKVAGEFNKRYKIQLPDRIKNGSRVNSGPPVPKIINRKKAQEKPSSGQINEGNKNDVSNAGKITEGSFSITERGWRGYPEGIPRPQGPFRVLEGAEYVAARKAANRANLAIRKADPGSLAGKEIHEIQPIKFGGSPIDSANKIRLPENIHKQQVTPWWKRFLLSLQVKGGGS